MVPTVIDGVSVVCVLLSLYYMWTLRDEKKPVLPAVILLFLSACIPLIPNARVPKALNMPVTAVNGLNVKQ
jgi:hypothetical protein